MRWFLRPLQSLLAVAFLAGAPAWAIDDQDFSNFAQASQALQRGELDVAESALRDLQARLPPRPEILNNLGVIAQRRGDLAQATLLVNAAAHLKPHYLSIHNNAQLLSHGVGVSDAAFAAIEVLPKPTASGSNSGTARPTSRRSVALTTLNRLNATAAEGAAKLEVLDAAQSTPFEEAPALALEQALEQWRRAWENQDVSAYLAWYASDFVPTPAISKIAWESGRRAVFDVPKTDVSITFAELSIKPEPSGDLVEFKQSYNSSKLTSRGRKSMRWRLIGGQWRIMSERFVGVPQFPGHIR